LLSVIVFINRVRVEHLMYQIRPSTISSLIFCSSWRISVISSRFSDSNDDVISADALPAVFVVNLPMNRHYEEQFCY